MRRARGLGLPFLAALLLAAPQALAADQSFEQIEHGRYLATAGDCAACHTVPGEAAFAGGRAIETPFGSLFAPNITPDRETGIGAWTDDDFVKAMQEGLRPDGAHLYPAFPYPYFARMTRDDIVAIRRYLQTIAPVKNAVDANQLPFPFSIRATMIGWNMLFFDKGAFKPDPAKSAEWNRGAYLVQGPGHCGACHTAKNLLGGDKNSEAFEGGALQGWFAPNLTGDMRKGLGGWSVEDVVAYLKTGLNHNATATGPMAEVVSLSTSRMHMEDLRAMAVYLKDSAAKSEPAQPLAASDPAMQRGKAVFDTSCSACHEGDGTGVPNLFPALAGAPNVQSANVTGLARVVLEGARGVATDAKPTSGAMPSFAWKYSDADIAAALTYIRNSWGNAAAPVTPADIEKARKQLAQTPK